MAVRNLFFQTKNYRPISSLHSLLTAAVRFCGASSSFQPCSRPSPPPRSAADRPEGCSDCTFGARRPSTVRPFGRRRRRHHHTSCFGPGRASPSRLAEAEPSGSMWLRSCSSLVAAFPTPFRSARCLHVHQVTVDLGLLLTNSLLRRSPPACMALRPLLTRTPPNVWSTAKPFRRTEPSADGGSAGIDRPICCAR